MRASVSTPALVKPIEKRGLAGVRVTHQRQRGERNCAPLAAMHRAGASHPLQFTLDVLDSDGDTAAIGFEFGFAGSACSDSAAQS